jgi:AraC-like DNA-binding protein
MLDLVFEDRAGQIAFQVTPHVFDSEIEPFLVEEALGAVYSVGRHLVGGALHPLCVDFAYRRGAPLAAYTRFFRCPVHFDTGVNRLSFDARWLAEPLPGHDPINSALLRRQLETLLPSLAGRDDLVESLSRRIRLNTEERPRQGDLALDVNLSERTLRRKLGQQALSYRRLRDEALFEKARDLLGQSSLTIDEVATAVGYADARAFRRAFKRWSG